MRQRWGKTGVCWALLIFLIEILSFYRTQKSAWLQFKIMSGCFHQGNSYPCELLRSSLSHGVLCFRCSRIKWMRACVPSPTPSASFEKRGLGLNISNDGLLDLWYQMISRKMKRRTSLVGSLPDLGKKRFTLHDFLLMRLRIPKDFSFRIIASHKNTYFVYNIYNHCIYKTIYNNKIYICI